MLSDFREFSNSVNEEGDRFAELGFDLFERDVGVFDYVVENASDDCIFIHIPFFKDFFDSEGMDDVGLTSTAKLASMSSLSELNGARNLFRINLLLSHYDIIIAW